MTRRLRRAGAPLVVRVLIVTMLAFGLAEIAARQVRIPDPTAVPAGGAADVLLDGSPWLLWELVPGTHRELGVTVEINADGFRGPDRGPRTVPRALALGDSSVYGFGVAEPEVFTAALDARYAPRAEFINGAVPGYSSFQALNLLEMRGLGLEPDLLIVGTLWSDNNFDSFIDRELLATYAGWEASWARVARLSLDGSALFRWLDWRFRVAPAGEGARRVGWQHGGDAPRSGRRRVAIADYASNLDRFCEIMRRRGGAVMFVQLANRVDIEVNTAGPAWGPYRAVMDDTAARYGAPIVAVPAVFRASGSSADALFLDQMHPTALGHGLIARAIAAELDARGWPETPIRLRAPPGPPGAYSDPFEGTGVVGLPPRR